MPAAHHAPVSSPVCATEPAAPSSNLIPEEKSAEPSSVVNSEPSVSQSDNVQTPEPTAITEEQQNGANSSSSDEKSPVEEVVEDDNTPAFEPLITRADRPRRTIRPVRDKSKQIKLVDSDGTSSSDEDWKGDDEDGEDEREEGEELHRALVCALGRG